MVKALAAGADTVMLGSLLAGTDEAPGRARAVRGPPLQELPRHGLDGRHAGSRSRSICHGAVGAAARQLGKLVPEGIEGRVAYAGTLSDVMYQLVGGLRSGMGYAGAATLEALRSARFMKVTTAGREESHPHDVTITKEAPNYQRGG